MSDRSFVLVHRPKSPPPIKTSYDDLSEAIAALKIAQAATDDPDAIVLVQIDTDDTSVTTTDLIVSPIRGLTPSGDNPMVTKG